MKRALLILFVAACGGPEVVTPAEPDPQPVKQEPQPEPQPQPQPQPLTGLPCDVRAALQANCAGCHAGAVYIPGFATRDELLKLGAKVTERLQSADQPMPPSGVQQQPTAEERALITSWVQAGMPAGECGALQR